MFVSDALSLAFGFVAVLSSLVCGELAPTPSAVVGSSGLEPPTSRLSGVRSNHLSYEPIFVAVSWLAIFSAYLCFASLSVPVPFVTVPSAQPWWR